MSQTPPPAPAWAQIDSRIALPGGAQAFARQSIVPLLETAPPPATTRKGRPQNRMDMPMSIGFFAFVGAFIAISMALPDNAPGVIARFVLFPVLFLGCLFGALWLFRGRLVESIDASARRFAIRAVALRRLADATGIAHTPAPGGAPESLKQLAKIGWIPPALKEAAALLDAHGGMDKALETARRSGALADEAHVVGSAQQKAEFHALQAQAADVEDGFAGIRGGVPFEAFEWKQSRGDSDTVHHLVMTFAAPRPLYGVTQLRTRGAPWPANPRGAPLSPVGVVAPEFEDRFRLRASDQVEARALFDPAVLERVARLAHGKPARAVASDRALVVTIEGADRFALIDIVTGAWSEDAIRRTMADIADMLDLADAVAAAFNLPVAANDDFGADPAD